MPSSYTHNLRRGVTDTSVPIRVGKSPAPLLFTEKVLLAAFSVAYLLSISDPVFGVQLQISALKHVPLILVVPALLLHLSGVCLSPERPFIKGIARTLWPFLVLSIFAISGSLVAKLQYDVDDSFMTFGIYLLLLPLFAASISMRTEAWYRALAFISVLFSFVALIGALSRYPVRQSMHEIEYIVIGGFFILYWISKTPSMKTLALLLIVITAVFNQKLTGYITGMLAVLYIVIEAGWRRAGPRWRGAYSVTAVVAVMGMVGLMVVSYFYFRDYLPSGSSEVRMKQYEQAFSQFIESPIWGHAYTAGSGEVYREYTRSLNIPTHSDVLDMLKHGGLIALGLFLIGYLNIHRLISKAIQATPVNSFEHGYFTTIRFFQWTALFTFSFNPILLKGPFNMVIGGTLGLAIGLAWHVLKHARGEESKPIVRRLRRWQTAPH